jgi:stage V sporulation protein D (sporulation-specific penicillin-binding protein)
MSLFYRRRLMKGSYRKGKTTSKIISKPRAPESLDAAREKKRQEGTLRPNHIKLKKREFLILIIFTLAFLFMTYRIGFIQFVKGEEYQRMAYANQTHKRYINPKRGTIYDTNGKGLAISASVDTVSVNPKELRTELETKKPSSASMTWQQAWQVIWIWIRQIS